MKLADWLSANGMTGSDLARKLGRDDATINRLIPKPGKKQVRGPGKRLLKQLLAATDGEVTANDFMDVIPTREPLGGNASKQTVPSRDEAA
jgi:hypothetical protein